MHNAPADAAVKVKQSLGAQNCLVLLPRCMECRRGLAMRILSVRLSVHHTRGL